MASTIPSQERVVDPFASYNSNVVNRLTEIATQGTEGMLTVNSMQVVQDATSINTVIVQTGYAIKDDVLINITAEHTVDFTDDDQWVTPPDAITFPGGNCYVVLDYQYAKQRPAPQANIKILQPSERGLIGAGSTYLLLKVVKTSLLSPHNITALYDYDPEVGYTSNERQYLKYYVSGAVNLPVHDQERDQGRIVYESETDKFYFGFESSWEDLNKNISGQISSWTLDATSGDYFYDVDVTTLSGPSAYISSWFDDSTDSQVIPSNVEIRDAGDTVRVYFPINTLTINYIIQD